MPLQAILVLLVVCVAAWLGYRRGGPPERLAAKIIVAWIVADAIYHLLFGPSGFEKVDPVHVVLDGAELAAILWLALNANRTWPLWAAAAQVICVLGHISALISPEGMRRAYWAMTQLPQYVQLIALLVGATAHARRVRLMGRYRSWRLV
jgi:hypothetical protein